MFRDEDGTLTEVPVTDGHCKMQWKCDWALRWAALDVDYEMSGKDLIDSVKLSSRDLPRPRRLPPEGFTYELFLDEQGQKISKSKGNGLTIEEWLRYGTRGEPAAVPLPRAAQGQAAAFRRDPAQVDEYRAASSTRFPRQRRRSRLGNPRLAHPRRQAAGDERCRSASACCSTCERRQCRGAGRAVGLHRPLRAGRHAGDRPAARRAGRARDRLLPGFRAADEALPRADRPGARGDGGAAAWLARPGADGATAEAIQHEVYEIGKRHGFANLRDWFKALYEVLLGQSEGPRFGSFVALYGVDNSRRLIEAALPREAAAHDRARPRPAGSRAQRRRLRPPQAGPAKRRGRQPAHRRRPRRPTERPPGGAGRAGPRAGPEHRAVRRDVPGPPAARCGWRSAIARSPGCWSRRCCAGWASSTTPCCRCSATGRRSCGSPTCSGWVLHSSCSCRRRRMPPWPRRCASRLAGFRREVPLLNAVLRKLAADGRQLLDGQDAAQLNTPKWLWDSWEAAYGEERAREIAEAHLAEPPLDLSVMRDAERWAERARRRDPADRHAAPAQRWLVEALPGFDRACGGCRTRRRPCPPCCWAIKGKRVLDIGAAPGGKTAQLASWVPRLPRSSVRRERAEFLVRNLGRLDARRRDRRRRRAGMAGRRSPSTPCCSTRPAPPPARSAAIRTCRGPRRPPT